MCLYDPPAAYTKSHIQHHNVQPKWYKDSNISSIPWWRSWTRYKGGSDVNRHVCKRIANKYLKPHSSKVSLPVIINKNMLRKNRFNRIEQPPTDSKGMSWTLNSVITMCTNTYSFINNFLSLQNMYPYKTQILKHVSRKQFRKMKLPTSTNNISTYTYNKWKKPWNLVECVVSK